MSIDVFWEQIFSDDAAQVMKAWGPLAGDERKSVFNLLWQIERDPERIEAQRAAATFAMATIRAAAQPPEGALVFAKQIARETAQILKTRFGATAASLKGDGSLVTESDMESDRRISEAIQLRFPDHAILSEERQKRFDGDEWTWLIDPIDGTTNFTWGFPCWGVLMTLLYFGEPVLAVCEFPALDEHYHAVRGQGVFLNELPVRAIQIEKTDAGQPRIQASHIVALCSRSIDIGVSTLGAKVRVTGSAGYDLILVASGVAIAASERKVYAWDIAAGWLFGAEARAHIATAPSQRVFPMLPGTICDQLPLVIWAACDPGILESIQRDAGRRLVNT